MTFASRMHSLHLWFIILITVQDYRRPGLDQIKRLAVIQGEAFLPEKNPLLASPRLVFVDFQI